MCNFRMPLYLIMRLILSLGSNLHIVAYEELMMYSLVHEYLSHLVTKKYTNNMIAAVCFNANNMVSTAQFVSAQLQRDFLSLRVKGVLILKPDTNVDIWFLT